jgi:hypothetical protein
MFYFLLKRKLNNLLILLQNKFSFKSNLTQQLDYFIDRINIKDNFSQNQLKWEKNNRNIKHTHHH